MSEIEKPQEDLAVDTSVGLLRCTVYYWENVNAVGDFAPGSVVAVASSIEHAIDLACASVFDGKGEELRTELRKKHPRIMSSHATPTKTQLVCLRIADRSRMLFGLVFYGTTNLHA